MDINKIKFVPKANAFAEVYGKATGVPFIGELVAAAAGNGGEPTPTTDYIVLAPPTVIDEWYDVNPKPHCSGGSCGVNMLFLSDLQRTTVRGACTVGDRTDTVPPMAINQISDTGTEYDGMYSLDFVFAFDGLTAGSHNFSVVITADGETFNINGSFTVPEEPPVVESVTVTARQNSTSECQMYGMESCYELWTVMTLNQNWITSNCSEGLYYNLTIKDSSDNTIVETSNGILNCAESNVVEGSDYPEGSMPTFPESGNYVLSIYNIETPDIHIFDGTGTWTYQDPQI